MSSFNFLKNLNTVSEKYPENIAFCIEGRDYSYNEFYQKVNAIAYELLTENNQQQKIVVVTNNDIETYASIIAIWLTGNIYIPLNLNEENTKEQSILNILQPDLILSSFPAEYNFSTKYNILNTSHFNKTTSTINTIIDLEKNIAYTLFTSGTTGTPKGVPISYQNLNCFVDSFLSLDYNFSDKDVFLQMADLTFDMSIISFLIPLCLGAKIVTINPTDIKYLATYSALSEQDITVLITAPSTLQLLKPFYSEINLKQLKHTFVGAEAFYESTAIEWQKCAPNSQITNLYGPSEGGIFASAYNWQPNSATHQETVSIGKPVKHINLHIVDDQGNIITNENKGEAWLSGPQVFNGYLDDLENQHKFEPLTIDGLTQQFYKTGDIVFRDSNENLFYCGRKDNQVKIQGKRVELSEIEHYANNFCE